jgi:hypothetical protein
VRGAGLTSHLELSVATCRLAQVWRRSSPRHKNCVAAGSGTGAWHADGPQGEPIFLASGRGGVKGARHSEDDPHQCDPSRLDVLDVTEIRRATPPVRSLRVPGRTPGWAVARVLVRPGDVMGLSEPGWPPRFLSRRVSAGQRPAAGDTRLPVPPLARAVDLVVPRGDDTQHDHFRCKGPPTEDPTIPTCQTGQ